MRIVINIVVSACALPPAGIAEVRYRVTPIGDLPGGEVAAVVADVNDSGMLSGSSIGLFSNEYAIVWSEQAGMTMLGDLPGGNVGSLAVAINNAGHAAGSSFIANGSSGGFYWTPDAGMIAIGSLQTGNDYSIPNGINNRDQIVGLTNGASPNEAFLWDPVDGMISLGDLPGGQAYGEANAINDSGEVTGASASGRFGGNHIEAFIWTAADGMQSLGDIPGGGYAYEGHGINNLGYVTGSAVTPQGVCAFIWHRDHGFTQVLPRLPGTNTSIGYDINDNMTMVVFHGTNDGAVNSVWDERCGMRQIDTLIDPCVPPLSQLRIGKISNSGHIAAVFRNVPLNRTEGALLTPYVPGDLDEDGVVTIVDLVQLLANFGRIAAVYPEGDLDCDADVDLQDLARLLSNFGEALP